MDHSTKKEEAEAYWFGVIIPDPTHELNLKTQDSSWAINMLDPYPLAMDISPYMAWAIATWKLLIQVGAFMSNIKSVLQSTKQNTRHG